MTFCSSNLYIEISPCYHDSIIGLFPYVQPPGYDFDQSVVQHTKLSSDTTSGGSKLYWSKQNDTATNTADFGNNIGFQPVSVPIKVWAVEQNTW